MDSGRCQGGCVLNQLCLNSPLFPSRIPSIVEPWTEIHYKHSPPPPLHSVPLSQTHPLQTRPPFSSGEGPYVQQQVTLMANHWRWDTPFTKEAEVSIKLVGAPDAQECLSLPPWERQRNTLCQPGGPWLNTRAFSSPQPYSSSSSCYLKPGVGSTCLCCVQTNYPFLAKVLFTLGIQMCFGRSDHR